VPWLSRRASLPLGSADDPAHRGPRRRAGDGLQATTPPISASPSTLTASILTASTLAPARLHACTPARLHACTPARRRGGTITAAVGEGDGGRRCGGPAGAAPHGNRPARRREPL